jgi:hypothetical protein
MVNNPFKTSDSRVVYNDGGLSLFNAENNKFLVGCVAVAVGQIMAFHEWPDRCSLPGDRALYFAMSTSDGGKTISYPFSDIVYDWNAMKARPKATDWGMSDSGKMSINVLLYEAGVNVNMTYGRGGSGAPTANIVPAFSNLGYDVSESAVRDYDYNTIVGSIDRKQPVIIVAYSKESITTTKTIKYHWIDIFHLFPQTTIRRSTMYKNGHAWVIDDYDVQYETDTSNGTRYQQPRYLVHCNLGWGGFMNGWYPDGFFDATERVIDNEMRSVASGISRSTSETTDGTDYVYKYFMKIIPFVKAKTF